MSSISRIHFGSIPMDIQRQITTYLEPHMVVTCAAVSKPFQKLMDSPQVWKGIAQKCYIQWESTSKVKEELRSRIFISLSNFLLIPENVLQNMDISSAETFYKQSGEYCRKEKDSLMVVGAHNKAIASSILKPISFEKIAALKFFATYRVGFDVNQLIEKLYASIGNFEGFRILLNHLAKCHISLEKQANFQKLLTDLCTNPEGGEYIKLVLETGWAMPTEKDIYVAILSKSPVLLKILFSYKKFDTDQIHRFLNFCDFVLMEQIADCNDILESEKRSERISKMKQLFSDIKDIINPCDIKISTSESFLKSDAFIKNDKGEVILQTKYYDHPLSLASSWYSELFKMCSDLQYFQPALTEFLKYSYAISQTDKDFVLSELMTHLLPMLHNIGSLCGPTQEHISLLANSGTKISSAHLWLAMHNFLRNEMDGNVLGLLFRYTSPENEKKALKTVDSWKSSNFGKGKKIQELRLIIQHHGISPSSTCVIL